MYAFASELDSWWEVRRERLEQRHPESKRNHRRARWAVFGDYMRADLLKTTGAHVVVINAEKARFTGKKAGSKVYARYSGYPGGRYEHTLDMLKTARPHDIVKQAVRRMLPKSTLARKMITRLKVYGGGEHPHAAQKPVLVEKLIR